LKSAAIILSLKEAQLLALNSQQLIQPIDNNKKNTVLQLIEHLGYIQIDTLSIVARAHHQVLWSRFAEYKESYLTQLLEKDKCIFEYWSHAASYLPMKDYRYTLFVKKIYANGKSHWFAQDKKMKKYVLDRIKAEGRLKSTDFEFTRTKGANWYEWKPAKRALEQLFMEGQLMVATRIGFQKVYDLTERVLPNHVNTSLPTEKEYLNYLIRRAIQANGIVNQTHISYLRKGLKQNINKQLKNLIKEGEIIEVGIEGLPDLYVTTKNQLITLNTIDIKNNVHILSPFDNLVIQRKRLNTFFNFDYVVECYLPEAKRKFGYFCLPILYDNAFVARMDCKADRTSEIFYIKSIHFEKNFKPTLNFNKAFAMTLKAFAVFNGCKVVTINNASPTWKKNIGDWLKQ
jgi:uncharacterized protein YcaQ